MLVGSSSSSSSSIGSKETALHLLVSFLFRESDDVGSFSTVNWVVIPRVMRRRMTEFIKGWEEAFIQKCHIEEVSPPSSLL